MSDEAPAAAPPPPPKGGSKLTLALLVLNLAGTGFIGMQLLKVKAAAGAESKAAEESVPAAAKSGPVVGLEPFVINLNEPGSSRYLKASFELELVNDATVDDLKRSTRAIRDDVLRYLSNLSVADTLGEANKNKMQEELIARIEKTLGPKKVTRLYFTEFVVQ